MSNDKISEVRLRRITIALALGLSLGVLLYLAVGNRENAAFFQGDFPAFYAAAEIVWTGRGEELYDYALQRELETHHWPDFKGSFYIYPYPPFFALFLSPLASYSPLQAKAIASVFLFVALLGAMVLARRSSDFIRCHFLFALVYLLSFVPLQMAIAGDQNTTLSILCFALMYGAERKGLPFLTGMFASLLLYKPQFGGLVFIYLLVRGRRVELIGWGLGALLLYLFGTLVLGLSWPSIWFESATNFGNLNFTINNYNMISLAGVMYWLSDLVMGSGTQGLPWAYLISAVLLMFSAWYVRRNPKYFVLVPVLTLWLSPQTLFYDVSIALFYFLCELRPYNNSDFNLLAGIWFYGIMAFIFRDLVTFPLFSVLLLGILYFHFPKLVRS
jgi:hypothetical protein